MERPASTVALLVSASAASSSSTPLHLFLPSLVSLLQPPFPRGVFLASTSMARSTINLLVPTAIRTSLMWVTPFLTRNNGAMPSACVTWALPLSARRTIRRILPSWMPVTSWASSSSWLLQAGNIGTKTRSLPQRCIRTPVLSSVATVTTLVS